MPNAVRRSVRLALRVDQEPARETERGGGGRQLIQVGVGQASQRCIDDSLDALADYSARWNARTKVLDFVQSGTPDGTVLRTFELAVAL